MYFLSLRVYIVNGTEGRVILKGEGNWKDTRLYSFVLLIQLYHLLI
jgi:hypothetical protein